MRVAFDAGGERGCDGFENAAGKFQSAAEEVRFGASAGFAADAHVEAAESEQREADAFGLAEEGEVALGFDGAIAIERGESGAGGENGAGGGRGFGGGRASPRATGEFGID